MHAFYAFAKYAKAYERMLAVPAETTGTHREQAGAIVVDGSGVMAVGPEYRSPPGR